MVNYRRVACEAAALAVLVAATIAAPAAPAPAHLHSPDCNHVVHYDQRQNGSDNVRVHVDGVVVAVMPAESIAESLLSALPHLSELLEESDFEIQKPKPPQSEVQNPPSIAPPQPEEKPQATPDKEDAPESLPVKPTEESTSEAGSTAQSVKNQKKEQYLKQRKAQRVKNYLASFLIPLLRKNRHH